MDIKNCVINNKLVVLFVINVMLDIVECNILCQRQNYNDLHSFCSDQDSYGHETLENLCSRLNVGSLTFNLKNTSILNKTDFPLCRVDEIHLEDNNLTEISPKTFEDIYELKKLTMSNNNLVKFHLSSLPQFNNEYYISSVDLSHNKIVEVIDDAQELKNFRDLDLSYNFVSDLSKIGFLNINRLERLSLSHNKLESIPLNTLSKLHNLQYFNLSDNKLHNLPFGVFNNLDQLTILDLSNNQLISNDLHRIYGLRHLRTFYFHQNQIDHFDFKDLPVTLGEVSFYGNKLPFTCQELAKIILKYNKVFINYGHDLETENIHGIACESRAVKENPAGNESSSLTDVQNPQIVFQPIRNESNYFLDQLKKILEQDGKNSTLSLNSIQFTLLTIILISILIILIILIVNLFKINLTNFCLKTRKTNQRPSNGLGMDSLAQQELLEI